MLLIDLLQQTKLLLTLQTQSIGEEAHMVFSGSRDFGRQTGSGDQQRHADSEI